MQRQRSGVVVLLMALALLLTLTIVNRRDVRGQAAAEPGDPAPTIGSCLTKLAPDQTLTQPPQLVLGSCDLGKFGEVYAVVNPLLAPIGSPISCGRELAGGYLGASAGRDAGWTPSMQFGLSVAGPDRKQQAAGQDWLACVVSPLSAGNPYQGSVAGAFAGGAIPSAFGQCSSTTQSRFPRPISCQTPHNTETFARLAVTGPGPGLSTLRAGCATLITAQTGMPDTSAGGALIVEALYFRHDTKGSRMIAAPLSAGEKVEAYCLISVAGPGFLDASLLGIGTRALPWV